MGLSSLFTACPSSLTVLACEFMLVSAHITASSTEDGEGAQ